MYGRDTHIRECMEKNAKKIVNLIAVFVILIVLGIIIKTAWDFYNKKNTISVTNENNFTENVLNPEEQPEQSEQFGVDKQKHNSVIEPGQEEKEPDTNRVVLDPGHGGYDVGSSKGDILEKDINLQIALKLRDKLEKMGYEVVMTREDDSHVYLNERVAIANESRADILVSIHQNSFEEGYVKGMETWYSGGVRSEILYRSTALGDDSRRLAQLLHYDMVSGTKSSDRGVRNGDLWVTSMTQIPSCLVEPGFISNKEERKKLTDVTYQMQLVECLAEGIQRFFDSGDMHLVLENVSIAENTTAVLDVLKERNVRAFFWVKPETVQEQPATIERLVEEGHEIGLYCDILTYSATYFGIDEMFTDLEAAYKMIYEMTGAKVKVFTFPDENTLNQADKNRIISAMTARGFTYSEKNTNFTTIVGEEDAEILIRNIGEKEKVILPARVDAYGVEKCLDEMLERYPQYKFDILDDKMENIRIYVASEATEETVSGNNAKNNNTENNNLKNSN